MQEVKMWMGGATLPGGPCVASAGRGVHDQCGQRSVLFTTSCTDAVISIDNSPAQNSVAYLPYTGELILDGHPFGAGKFKCVWLYE
jgi:hypothetical protein